jgi:hypothetical protein
MLFSSVHQEVYILLTSGGLYYNSLANFITSIPLISSLYQMTSINDVGTMRLSKDENLLAIGTSVSFYILIYNLNVKSTVLCNKTASLSRTSMLTWHSNSQMLYLIDTAYATYAIYPFNQTLNKVFTIGGDMFYFSQAIYYL